MKWLFEEDFWIVVGCLHQMQVTLSKEMFSICLEVSQRWHVYASNQQDRCWQASVLMKCPGARHLNSTHLTVHFDLPGWRQVYSPSGNKWDRPLKWLLPILKSSKQHTCKFISNLENASWLLWGKWRTRTKDYFLTNKWFTREMKRFSFMRTYRDLTSDGIIFVPTFWVHNRTF